MAKNETKEKLLLIDANSLLHRSFHALPPFKTPDGHPSGALYGLASILIRVFRERPPKYAAAAFDRPEPTFRKKEYKEYKGTRKPTPNDLISQLVYATPSTQVTDSWIAGKQVMKNRTLTHLDLAAIHSKANQWAKKIQQTESSK